MRSRNHTVLTGRTRRIICMSALLFSFSSMTMGLLLHQSTTLSTTRTSFTKAVGMFVTSSTRRRRPQQQLLLAAFSSSATTTTHFYSHRRKQQYGHSRIIIPTTSTIADRHRFLFSSGGGISSSLSGTAFAGDGGDSNNSNNNNNNNVITSPKSATVKKVHALLTKRKKRIEYNQAIVEGPRMVYDLLENPTTRPLVQQVLISTDNDNNYHHYCDDHSRSESLLREAKHVQYILPEILKKVCSDTVTPQGIVAIVDIPDYNKMQQKQKQHKYPLHLILDGVSDPGNVGTLLRSSLAVGVESVILLPGCCDVWNPKAIRSAMGASFQIPIIQSSSFHNAMDMLSSSSSSSSTNEQQQQPVQRFFAATMLDDDDDDIDIDGSGSGSGSHNHRRRSIPHFDVNWIQEPTAIIIGSEGNGLSEEIRNILLVDGDDNENKPNLRASHIPMTGNIESLNAAVCGSVILFEYQRQCEMSNRK